MHSGALVSRMQAFRESGEFLWQVVLPNLSLSLAASENMIFALLRDGTICVHDKNGAVLRCGQTTICRPIHRRLFLSTAGKVVLVAQNSCAVMSPALTDRRTVRDEDLLATLFDFGLKNTAN